MQKRSRVTAALLGALTLGSASFALLLAAMVATPGTTAGGTAATLGLVPTLPLPTATLPVPLPTATLPPLPTEVPTLPPLPTEVPTLPPLPLDLDGDFCADSREIGPDWRTGGQRDPLASWDFFDVPAPISDEVGVDGRRVLDTSSARNHVVSLQDVAAVLAFVGRTIASPEYLLDRNLDAAPDGWQLDRTASAGPAQLWRSGPPNGAVSLADVAVALAQVGSDCR